VDVFRRQAGLDRVGVENLGVARQAALGSSSFAERRRGRGLAIVGQSKGVRRLPGG